MKSPARRQLVSIVKKTGIPKILHIQSIFGSVAIASKRRTFPIMLNVWVDIRSFLSQCFLFSSCRI
jgi:hypothetical protein